MSYMYLSIIIGEILGFFKSIDIDTLSIHLKNLIEFWYIYLYVFIPITLVYIIRHVIALKINKIS